MKLSLSVLFCFCACSLVGGLHLQAQSQSSTQSPTQSQAPGPAPQPPVTSGITSSDTANDLFVTVGKSVLVDSAKPISRISVGLGEVAEAIATSPTEVLVNGKAPGETSLIVWDSGGGRQFFNVTVHASVYVANDRVETVRRQLKTELAGQNLRVTAENGLVFLRGTVKDLTSSERAVQIASTAGKVVNLLYVNVPPPNPQILLKVRFASVDRSLTRNLCWNLFSLGAANSIGSVTTQQCSAPAISSNASSNTGSGATGSGATATLSNLLNLFIFRKDINLGATIQALQNQGLLQLLAEPNLLTSNGKQGSFLAGGEYPYPTVQGVGGTGTAAVTIQFKEFGVRLNFIPTITPRNTIRLQVAPEVSSLDFVDGITIQGFTVPALTTRKVKTEVELSEGQSFAIGGLLDNRETKTFEKIPFIGDIPILGRFFQSVVKTRNNTELMVIVTPEIVAPIPAGTPLPALKYPDAFLPSLSGIPMTTPGASVTGATPLAAPTPTMPVEQLLQSMQPEQPLMVETGMASGSSYGMGSGAQTGATTTAPTAAPPSP